MVNFHSDRKICGCLHYTGSLRSEPILSGLTAVFCCNVLEYIRNNNTFLIL